MSSDGPSGAAAPSAGQRPARPRKLLFWALAASTAGFVFGYQLGVISGALLLIRRDLGLSSFEQGLLVSIMPLGAMAGGLLTVRLGDALGRRQTLILDAIVFIVGIVLSVVAQGYALLLIGRAIVGLGVGSVSSTVPLYLSEIAPPALRGRLVTIQQIMITLGILVSYCVDLIFAGSGSWRAMFAVGLLPAGILLVGMLRSPETPAWLDAHGDEERAREVVLQVAGEDEAPRLLEDIRRMSEQQRRQLPARQLLTSEAARPALILGISLAAIQQFSGINTIVSYAPRIMQETGLNVSHSILYSVIIGALNVVVTVAAIRLVDRRGRRPLMLGSLAGMLVALVLLGLTFELSLGSAGSWLALVCILGYVAAFATGLGPVYWVLIAEISPPSGRAAGASVSTTVVWLSNFLVVLAFLPVASAIGTGPTFWLFAGVCAIGLWFVNRYVPETKGRSFTEVDADVRSRWESGGARPAAA
jgi:MFS transporter, SP family, galactose:H+ symporter